ncbi:RND transporter [Labrys miyagiensis]|uniref:RND transporter n=1 Tax=Labrys miyagiensis TaxID=346912 RepID=A0ABQ6CUJ1_9HYPH|nr:efflux RND transporter periplasmic adaptor subunit [Labrys miyagiensis]GLS23257.1 RND transporter [Labrys miyagiensis]
MKRLFNFVLILVLLGGLIWWQRATVVPWVAKTLPGSEAYIAKVPFLAGALHPADAQQAASDAGGRSRRSNSPVPVILATAGTKQLPIVIDAVGTATPYASIQIRTRIDNTAVTSVRVAEGAEVKQDDILFTLDDRTIKAQISQIEAQIVKDQAQIAQAQIDLGRANDLLSRNAGAATTRDTAATALKMAQAQLQADQASLDSAKATLDYTVIRAPVPGRIGSIPVKPGSTVRTSDSAPLATLNQLDPAVAAFSIPQDRLSELREAMTRGPVRVDVTTGKHTLTGAVTFIENNVDPSTGTVLIKADIPNPSEILWAGVFVNVQVIFPGTTPQVVVPNAAVQIGQKGNYVFVVKDGKTASLRPVAVARVAGSDAVLTSGVDDGEQVVIDGTLRLIDGATVSIATAAKS